MLRFSVLLCLALTACAAPPLVAPDSSPSVAPRAATSPPLPSVGWQQRLASETQEVQAQLAFWALVPSYMPFDVQVQVGTPTGCGIGPSPCIDYRFTNSSGSLVLLVLQGTAGCCLDVARPWAVPTIDIRPGVRAQYIPVEPQFGGSILWWVEDTARGPVYAALSGPVISQADLIRIASSMRPLDGTAR